MADRELRHTEELIVRIGQPAHISGGNGTDTCTGLELIIEGESFGEHVITGGLVCSKDATLCDELQNIKAYLAWMFDVLIKGVRDAEWARLTPEERRAEMARLEQSIETAA